VINISLCVNRSTAQTIAKTTIRRKGNKTLGSFNSEIGVGETMAKKEVDRFEFWDFHQYTLGSSLSWSMIPSQQLVQKNHRNERSGA